MPRTFAKATGAWSCAWPSSSWRSGRSTNSSELLDRPGKGRSFASVRRAGSSTEREDGGIIALVLIYFLFGMPSNGKQRLVSQYMHRHPKTLPPGATLKDSIALMIEEQTNGLVVVDASGRVAGILSSWDVISRIVPDYLEEDQHLAAFEAGDLFATRVQALAGE